MKVKKLKGEMRWHTPHFGPGWTRMDQAPSAKHGQRRPVVPHTLTLPTSDLHYNYTTILIP